jgi:hypothetical protein
MANPRGFFCFPARLDVGGRVLAFGIGFGHPFWSLFRCCPRLGSTSRGINNIVKNNTVHVQHGYSEYFFQRDIHRAGW